MPNARRFRRQLHGFVAAVVAALCAATAPPARAADAGLRAYRHRSAYQGGNCPRDLRVRTAKDGKLDVYGVGPEAYIPGTLEGDGPSMLVGMQLKDREHIRTGGTMAGKRMVLYPDAPGASNIQVAIDRDVGHTDLAGLRFTTEVTVGIRKDGTVQVSKPGVQATTPSGTHYVSRRAELRGREVFVMVRAPGRAGDPERPSRAPDVARRYRSSSKARLGVTLDTPGARDTTLKPGGAGQATEYAGLKFTRQTAVSILMDRTLVVTEEGVVGTDKGGRRWQSQRVVLDGETVIAFFPAAAPLPATAPPPKRNAAQLPPFHRKLAGRNPVRIRNPNPFTVKAGVRCGTLGVDLLVPPNGTASAHVPDGSYKIYFIYSTKPDALFQGDDFALRRNGVEIRIVKVVGGNYNIRQVR